MRGKIIAALAATLLTITAGVLAQTSGFPSRPRFQAVTVAQPTGSGFNPQVMCANGEASSNRCWAFRIGGAADFQISTADDAGASVGAAISVTRSGTTVTDVLVNGVTVLPETGTSTITITQGCTTTPTPSLAYSRVGKLVTLHIGNWSCTENNTVFLFGTLPASLRPSATRNMQGPGVDDNGVVRKTVVSIGSTGVMSMVIENGGGVTGWAGTGLANAAPWTYTYAL